MNKVARAAGHGRLTPERMAQLDAAMAEAWAAVDAAWKRLAAKEAAARGESRPAARPADGIRLGGGGGDPSAIGLPNA